MRVNFIINSDLMMKVNKTIIIDYSDIINPQFYYISINIYITRIE